MAALTDTQLHQCRERLAQGLAGMQLPATAQQVDQLMHYLAELVRWNQAFNLTAIREPMAMVDKHLLDSASILPWLGEGSLIDVGTGAGLPGVIIAILRPELAVTVLDSNQKKTRFITQIKRQLDLANLTVVSERCEQHVGQYAQVCSRAFASLKDMIEGTQHMLAPNGRWLAMKGHVLADEVSEIPAYVAIENHPALDVPFAAEARHVFIMRQR